MNISKVLKANNIPEIIKKRETKAATMNLVSTPEVVPQTSYMTSGLILAAMVAGGFVYKKNQKGAKEDDQFSALI